MTSSVLNVTTKPRWMWAAAGLGTIWNAYGAVQFAGSLSQTPDSLMALGLTQAQATLYHGLPVWMTLVFGIGVFGGLAGSLALGLQLAISRQIFAVSLVAYVLLFAGDAYHGVFAAIPSQFAIISLVVAVAASLLWASERAHRQDLLK